MINYETEQLMLRNYQSKDAADYFEYMRLESTALHEDFEPYTLEECNNTIPE